MQRPNYRALLIGNSTFPVDANNLQTLEGPVNDVTVLRAALTDDDTGLFPAGAVRVVPERTTSEVLVEMEKFFSSARRDDTLLLYYSGHGLLDDKNQLYLAARDTRTDLLKATAICASDINAMVDDSPAQTTVIVLDCCHSGAFKSGDFPASLRGTGRFLLTSCRGGQLANDADRENGTSIFTSHLVEGLRRDARDLDDDGFVTLDDVYEYVHARLVDEGKQIPQRSFAGGGDVAIAARAKPPASSVPAGAEGGTKSASAGGPAPVLPGARPADRGAAPADAGPGALGQGPPPGAVDAPLPDLARGHLEPSPPGPPDTAAGDPATRPPRPRPVPDADGRKVAPRRPLRGLREWAGRHRTTVVAGCTAAILGVGAGALGVLLGSLGGTGADPAGAEPTPTEVATEVPGETATAGPAASGAVLMAKCTGDEQDGVPFVCGDRAAWAADTCLYLRHLPQREAITVRGQEFENRLAQVCSWIGDLDVVADPYDDGQTVWLYVLSGRVEGWVDAGPGAEAFTETDGRSSRLGPACNPGHSSSPGTRTTRFYCGDSVEVVGGPLPGGCVALRHYAALVDSNPVVAVNPQAYIGNVVGKVCAGDTARVITDAFQVGDGAVPPGSYASWLRIEVDGSDGKVYGVVPADQDEANPTVRVR